MSSDNTAFEVSLGKATSGFTKLLRELGADGKQVVEKLDDDPAYARRIARFMQAGGYNPSTDQKRAREIMGENYLGPEDVMKHFNVSFTDIELAQLREIPFTESTLEACKKTHILFAGYPLSILEIRGKAKNLFYDQDWYDNENFAKKEKVNLQWHLIRKDEMPSSTSKTWQQQQSLLTANEITPRACEVIYMVMLDCLVTGKRLLAIMYVRCSDLASDGHRVIVGLFDSGGLHVDDYSDDGCNDYLGLAAARK
jgi:hypothetical protein